MQIALIGSAPASIRLAPYMNPEWEIWGCSPGTYGVMPRCTGFFELHLWEPGAPWFSPEYCQFLKDLPKRGIPLWVGSQIDDIPGAIVLPHQELLDEFDPSCWFPTSSLFWMMAVAIKAIQADRANRPAHVQIQDKIGMWGVDMAHNTEYEAQRSGIHYMTYVAQKMGIEVGAPMESCVFMPRFKYGIDEWTHSFRKSRARMAELQQRQAAAQAQAEASKHESAFLQGAMDDLRYMSDNWVHKDTFVGPKPPPEPPPEPPQPLMVPSDETPSPLKPGGITWLSELPESGGRWSADMP